MKNTNQSVQDSNHITLTGSWVDVALCNSALPLNKKSKFYKEIEKLRSEAVAQLSVSGSTVENNNVIE